VATRQGAGKRRMSAGRNAFYGRWYETWRCNILTGDKTAAWFDVDIRILRTILKGVEQRPATGDSGGS